MDNFNHFLDVVCVCKEWVKFKERWVPRLLDETSTGSRLEDLRHHEDTAKSL